MSMRHHGEGRGSGHHDPMGDGHDNFRYHGKATMAGHRGHSTHPIHTKRARGGRTEDPKGEGHDDERDYKGREESYAGTGSETEKEAERRKRGGKAPAAKVPARATGGSVAAKPKPKVAKLPALAVGGAATRHVRMDRRGRKRGGSVGADSHPLTTASRMTEAEGEKTHYSALDAEDD